MARGRRALALLAAAVAAAARASEPSGPPAAAGPTRPVVSDVRIDAAAAEDAAALQRLVTIRPGQALDARAVRRTLQLMYGSARCANVVALTQPAPPVDGMDAVVLTLECLPRTVVAAVRVVDADRKPLADDAAIRSAAGLARGDELWEGRLDDARARIRAGLLRRGYRDARVEATTSGGRQATVELVVTRGAATRVGEVGVAMAGGGPPGLAEKLRGALRTVPGAVLDLDTLEEDVRVLRAALRQHHHLRGRVGAPVVRVDGAVARVDFPVDAGPRFELRFPGASVFTGAELRERAGLEAEQIVDATAIEAAAARIRAFYQSYGYATAAVTVAETARPDAVVLSFTIDEGRRYRVRAVRFTGATRDPGWLRARVDDALASGEAPAGVSSDAERLARAVGSPAAVRSRPAVDPAEVWDPPAWDRAAQRLIEAYRAEGYLDAAHERTRVELDARSGTVDVELVLREGVRTRVESVAFEGNRAIATAELERLARLAPGDPLGYGAVETTRTAVLDLYSRRGFLYARVADAEDLSADRAQARVRFRIEEGPQVRVGTVLVQGARRTREDVVRDALALKPGDVYEPDAASKSQAALLRLGVFRSVGLRLTDPEVPDETKDLTVDLAERPWRTLAPGVGFSLANGPRVFVEYLQPNLFGRALELSARAKVNYPLDTFRPDLVGKPFLDRIEGRGDVGLHDPRVHLFGTQVGARVDAIVERLHRRAYDLGRASTVFGLDVPAASRLTVSLQYELEVDHLQQTSALTTALTLADVERLRFPQGFTTLHSVRPVIALDLRDNPLHPRSGLLASGTLDYVHSLGGPNASYLFGLFQGSGVFTHMLKVSAAVTGYVPVGSQSVFALSLRGGRVVPLEANSVTIGPKRFYLGGAATMRGYEEDEMIPEDRRGDYLAEVQRCATSLSGVACSPAGQQVVQGQTPVSVGGEAFLLAKAELRIPLRSSLEAGLFADAGNLWTDPNLLSLSDLRFNVGFGLRFASPIGPAVLDVGFNVSPDPRLNERVVAPHFSIGLF